MKLDIRNLMEYSGQGKCREGRCYCYCYREQLRTWDMSKNWAVTCDDDYFAIKWLGNNIKKLLYITNLIELLIQLYCKAS